MCEKHYVRFFRKNIAENGFNFLKNPQDLTEDRNLH